MSYIGETALLFPIVSLTSHPRREQSCPRSNMAGSARRGLENLIWQLFPESDFGMSRQTQQMALPVFMNSHWWKLAPPSSMRILTCQKASATLTCLNCASRTELR